MFINIVNTIAYNLFNEASVYVMALAETAVMVDVIVDAELT